MYDNGLNSAQLQYDRQEPPEDKPKLICCECECGIYEGDLYFEIDNKIYCETCTEDEYGRLA